MRAITWSDNDGCRVLTLLNQTERQFPCSALTNHYTVTQHIAQSTHTMYFLNQFFSFRSVKFIFFSHR